MRSLRKLLDQAVRMHKILSEGPPTEHTAEILHELNARIVYLTPHVELREVTRIHGNLDKCGVPEDSKIRELCGKTLLLKLAVVNRQIPTPATT